MEWHIHNYIRNCMLLSSVELSWVKLTWISTSFKNRYNEYMHVHFTAMFGSFSIAGWIGGIDGWCWCTTMKVLKYIRLSECKYPYFTYGTFQNMISVKLTLRLGDATWFNTLNAISFSGQNCVCVCVKLYFRSSRKLFLFVCNELFIIYLSVYPVIV